MEGFWPDCLKRFEQELTSQQFNTWIKPLKFEAGTASFRLIAPNKFVLQWIKDRFLSRIETMAAEYFKEPLPQVYLCLASLESVVASSQEKAPTYPHSTNSIKKEPLPDTTSAGSQKNNRKEIPRINQAFTFSNFISGRANQLARAAAINVAENPGVAYNPLFVYGGVGLGKTHLIQAIGNMVLENNHTARVRYLHAERYVSDVVRAYQHKSFDEFKRDYHSLDVLLIDDIQFFSGKSRTQEEFFYVFNALTESHKQVIITCDTYPKEIEGMEDRLISRFGWGLTVSIDPPELEMRVAILINKAKVEGISLSEDVAFFIAKQIHSNVRELEGALKRVLAFSRFSGHPVSLGLAKEALKDLLAVQNRQISIENIQKTVADYYKIKVADMYSRKRSQQVARPRQVAMALAKELTNLSLPAIGDAFGGRDHTTVLHACRKILELTATDPTLMREFNMLIQVLRG
ncbi:MAG: chromosomal replication initiator protein DnaA [Proteobacteria bacterium]|nr:chromosomal replication initiator protein DnaA [Pseudomonadota bacterium]